MQLSCIILVLMSENFRQTKTRQTMIGILSDSKAPVSALDIINTFKNLGIKVHKTTIYRDLDQFSELGLIEEIDFGDGIKRFELSNLGHHHHLICQSCKNVEDIEVEDEQIIENLPGLKDFKITRHSLEIFGLCGRCQ